MLSFLFVLAVGIHVSFSTTTEKQKVETGKVIYKADSINSCIVEACKVSNLNDLEMKNVAVLVVGSGYHSAYVSACSDNVIVVTGKDYTKADSTIDTLEEFKITNYDIEAPACYALPDLNYINHYSNYKISKPNSKSLQPSYLRQVRV